MRQTILSDPQLVLKTTEANGEPLPAEWEGNFQFIMTTVGTGNVNLQVEHPVSGTWVTLRVGARNFRFTQAGDTLTVQLARGFTYRLQTATAGAEIYASSL